MTIHIELSPRIQNALWETTNLARGVPIANSETPDSICISAYLAFVMNEADCKNDKVALEKALRRRISNDWAVDYLVSVFEPDCLDIAAILKNLLSQEELRELVLHLNDEEPFNRSLNTHSTPDSIRNLAHAILGIRDGERVADLGCGRGDFLISAAESASGLHLFGIDTSIPCAVLTAIRFDLLDTDGVVELGDMLEAEIPSKFDKVFSNFPFGMRPTFMRGKGEYYESMRFGREGIGRPTSADWLFNKLAYDSLAEGGKAVTIMTNGAAFNGGDLQARRYFIKNGMVEAVVALPSNLFPGISMSTVLIVLGKNDGPIRMVDASDLSISGRRWDTLGKDEIAEILNRLANDGDSSRLVSAEELATTKFNLFPSRYLGRCIELENAAYLGDLALSIERGASITAHDLDMLTVDEDTGLSFLRLSDISDGCIGDDLPHLRELDPKTEKQWLRTGDLIVSKNGAPFKIAVAEVPEGKTILANGNLYIIRLDTERIDPYFVAAFLASDDGKELMERMVVGTTIPNLPLRNLKDIQLPVPDKNVQDAVARQYRARLDEIEVLKIKLEKARIGAASSYDEVVGR